jgi:hypothetical protein
MDRVSAPPSSLTSRSKGCSAYFLACRRVQKKWPSVTVQTRKSTMITTKKMICMVFAWDICALPSEEAVEDGRDEVMVEGAEVLSYGTSRDKSWAEVRKISELTSWRAKERYHKPRPGGRRPAAEGKRMGEIDRKGREKVSSRAGAPIYICQLHWTPQHNRRFALGMTRTSASKPCFRDRRKRQQGLGPSVHRSQSL